LTNLAPVPSTPGYGIPQAEAAAAAAAQDAQAAGAAAVTAGERATSAAASAAKAEQVTVTTGEVVGDDLILTKGDGSTKNAGNVRGPVGPAGPNTIPTDEAVAQVLTSSGASAQAAALDLIDSKTQGVYAPIAESTVRIGAEALASQPASFDIGSSGTVVALGTNAMANMVDVTNGIAIGTNAQGEGTHSRENIAIGDSALQHVQATKSNYDQNAQEGTRNIGIGGNALRFNKAGHRHIAIGRNAGHCIEDGMGLVAIGVGANGGAAPIGLSGEVENWAKWGTPGQRIRATAVGLEASARSSAPNSVAVGGDALHENKKSDNNVGVGARALYTLDVDTGYNGGTYVVIGKTGTYSQSRNVLTVTVAAHGLAVGDIAYLRMPDGGSATFANDEALAYVATVPDANTFTITHPLSITSTGTFELNGKETAVQKPRNENNVAVGTSAGGALKTSSSSTAIGAASLAAATASDRVTALGYQALGQIPSGSNSVGCGYYAAGSMTGNANAVTAVGASALRNKIDNTPLTEGWSNIIGIGFDSRVSGENQAQIGNSSVTTYVYGTVQNRSDARDKADIRDTELGLGFIEKLRPVDYKWDMREDYDGAERDGSKKRTRYHHGLIAQEIQQVIEETGADFGGFQDHSVNGGSDVLSIGYDELIAPLIKAVQELSARVRQLES